MGAIVLLIIIAAVCGAVGARLAGRKGVGCLGSIALGFIGAVLGSWIAGKLDLPIFLDLPLAHGFPVIWSVIGAALFVAVLGLLSGHKGRDAR